MHNRLFVLLPLAVALTAGTAGRAAADTQYDFNPEWRLLVGDPKGAGAPTFDDSSWKAVTLPHAWNEDEAFAKDIHDLSTGVAWYRKHFALPADAAGKKVFLEFEGIRHGGEFFVNGKSVGLHENGVMAFGLDVTDALNPPGKDNVIAARVDSSWNYHERATKSSYEWADRNFYANYGGINKNVILHVADRLHQTLPLYSNLGTTGVYIYASDIDIPAATAVVHAESQVKNDSDRPMTFTYEVTVEDLDGKQVAAFPAGQPVTLDPGKTTTVSASSKLAGLHFWSWGYGYLYTVRTTLRVDGKAVDTVDTRTGFRKTAFDHGYLTLNDRPIQVHGYAQRTTNEWPAVGNAVPAWVSDFSNGLMVASNANLVRWMHVTPWKQDVESCDRVGLMEAMPAGDAEKDVEGRRWEQRVELMRDAIIYNRNNPSIVFYESGNNGISEAHMAEMKNVRDTYDPHGGRAIGARNMLDSKVAEYGGEMLYIDKSAGKPLWAMEYARDEALRKYWDELTPPYHKEGDGPVRSQKESPRAYNHNQDTFSVEDVVRWYDYFRERPGTGNRVSAGGVNIIFADSNTHFRGAQNYRRSGEVDAVRIPKDAFFAHQVMWDGWVNPEHPRVHIFGHWNYDKPVTKTVRVVCNTGTEIELLLNGKLLGAAKPTSGFLYSFPNVKFEPGTLEARTVGSGDTFSDVLRTAGAPHGLKLTSHVDPAGFRADGANLALVDVEVVDKDGVRCPTALNRVHFTLTGPAEWRGGIAQDDDRPDNYILSKDLPVQCGVNRVLIRSTPEAGTITLRAESPDLAPAEVTLGTTAVAVDHGLAALAASPKASLARGPTPAGSSIVVTRNPLAVAHASAGANAADAIKTYDDDEVTSWSNDGKLSTAWIQYDLSAPATVSEICLKLGNWRTKSYPLHVTVDGRDVYTGTTPPSLGYVTLELKPTTGRSVRIALAGESKSSDALDLTEVTGKKNIDAPAGGTTRGSLTVVEAELYGPAPAGVPSRISSP